MIFFKKTRKNSNSCPNSHKNTVNNAKTSPDNNLGKENRLNQDCLGYFYWPEKLKMGNFCHQAGLYINTNEH
jgi:hypothetical protein